MTRNDSDGQIVGRALPPAARALRRTATGDADPTGRGRFELGGRLLAIVVPERAVARDFHDRLSERANRWHPVAATVLAGLIVCDRRLGDRVAAALHRLTTEHAHLAPAITRLVRALASDGRRATWPAGEEARHGVA